MENNGNNWWKVFFWKMNLDGSKATPNGDISANILKSAVDI